MIRADGPEGNLSVQHQPPEPQQRGGVTYRAVSEAQEAREGALTRLLLRRPFRGSGFQVLPLQGMILGFFDPVIYSQLSSLLLFNYFVLLLVYVTRMVEGSRVNVTRMVVENSLDLHKPVGIGGWGTMERKRTLRGSGREFDTIAGCL